MNSPGSKPTPSGRRATVDVAVVVPLQGSAGIFGPSSELCARLAAEEVNAGGGILDREVRLQVVDGSAAPAQVARALGALAARGAVDAVVGWHISAVRRAVAPHVAPHVPYVYTALYEGGERTPGLFLAGETPDAQLLPAMRWLAEERGVRRWCIVGNDYVWPRRTAAAAREYASEIGGTVSDELFVPLNTTRFTPVIGRLIATNPDAVLMLLVGQDAARFNRAFADAGLDERCGRLSTLVEENTLLASGAAATRGLCASAGYFESLVTPEGQAFGARYAARFGAEAPMLNSPAESCYEGLLLLSALARRAGSLAVGPVEKAAAAVEYEGPRGGMHMSGRHVQQRVYLAAADGLAFDIVAQL